MIDQVLHSSEKFSLIMDRNITVIFSLILAIGLIFLSFSTFGWKIFAGETAGTETLKADVPGSISFLLRQEQKITAQDGGEGDVFGLSVAISGDTAVIGACNAPVGSNLRQGAAYVYVRDKDQWEFQQKLVANDGAFNDTFGLDVAIAGDTIVVGAPWDNIGSTGFNHGSAYVFQRTGSVWIQKYKLLPNDSTSENIFGESVALFGNTAFVGARNDDNFRGAVYVFEFTENSWSQKQKLTASNGQPSDAFGISMKMDGNSAFIAAPLAGNVDQGLVYLFEKENGVWIERQIISADDGLETDFFGAGIDFSAEGILAVTAPGDDNGNVSDQGSVYIFEKNNDVWTQIQKINVPEITVNENFGSSLSISGKYFAVGASFANVGGNVDQGAVYLFEKTAAGWQFREKITAAAGTASDSFGFDVALSDRNLIAGAHTDDVNGNANQGSAYIFNIQNSDPKFDFDGDGKSDISVFRPSSGDWYYLRSSDQTDRGFSFGQTGDRIVPADFTGDNLTDIAIYRKGIWYILRSEDASFYAFEFGLSADLPAPADYDGDGRADAAVYRPADGFWYIQKSSNDQIDFVRFGAAEDRPVAEDYDGAGRADVAVYRPSANRWFLLRSTEGFASFIFGIGEDRTVPADYTGDGKADVAVWRPSNGVWYILRSEDNSFYAEAFGTDGDSPVSGDFDGDGRTDTAVYRPSQGVWYINGTQAGFAATQFGTIGDIPVPSAFNTQ